MGETTLAQRLCAVMKEVAVSPHFTADEAREALRLVWARVEARRRVLDAVAAHDTRELCKADMSGWDSDYALRAFIDEHARRAKNE